MLDLTAEAKPQTQVPPPEILKIVGLSHEEAQAVVTKRSAESALEDSKERGKEAYKMLKDGKSLDEAIIGNGVLTIEPSATAKEFISEVVTRSSEVNPAPPKDQVKAMLESFAAEALTDKDFGVAVACFNYISDENLKGNDALISKLNDAAKTSDEKFDLGQALAQVMTVSTETQTKEPQLSEQPVMPEIKPVEQKTPEIPPIPMASTTALPDLPTAANPRTMENVSASPDDAPTIIEPIQRDPINPNAQNALPAVGFDAARPAQERIISIQNAPIPIAATAETPPAPINTQNLRPVPPPTQSQETIAQQTSPGFLNRFKNPLQRQTNSEELPKVA